MLPCKLYEARVVEVLFIQPHPSFPSVPARGCWPTAQRTTRRRINKER